MPPDHPLPFPEEGTLPARVEPVGPPSDELVHASPAARRPVRASSPTAALHGTELEGVERATAAGCDLLRALRTGAGTCSNVLLGPRGFRRELVGPGGSVLETALAADRHPGVVVQWHAAGPGGLALEVRWRVPGEVVAQRSSGTVLRVRLREGADRIFAVVPAPVRWELEGGGGGDGLGVRLRVGAGEGGERPVSLLAAAVERDDPGRSVLAALSRTGALTTRRRAFVHAVRTELLATRTGVAELDDGLAWAVARIAGEVPPGRDAPPSNALPERDTGSEPDAGGRPGLDRFWMLAGALAAGHTDAARRWIARAPRQPADVLALGWWVRWTGDLRPFLRFEREALDLLADHSGDAPPGVAALVRQAARNAVADALEAAGKKEEADRLRLESGGEVGGSGPASAPTERPVRGDGPPGTGAARTRLPMLGGGPAPADDPGHRGHESDPGGAWGFRRDEELLAAILAGLDAETGSRPALAPALAADPPPSGVDRALLAWALYAAGQPEEGYLHLRSHLAEGVHPPVGFWQGGGGAPSAPGSLRYDPVAVALGPAGVVHGLLGARAEAPWGRLRLAPAFPESWSRFEVGGLRVADARVSLGYARGEGTHTFLLQQTAGRAPLNLVFQPSVPGAVLEVRVDGGPTDVTPEQRTGRARIRLQLPLDAPRRVTLVRSET